MQTKARGISTVIGGLIFVILLVAGLSALAIALDSQKNMVTTQQNLFDTGLQKQQENFQIQGALNSTNYLHVYVTNNGQNPIKINSVWILDPANNGANTARYDIDYANSLIMPGEKLKDVLPAGNTTSFSSNSTIKAVSKLGSIVTASLPGGANTALLGDIFVIPQDVRPSGAFTVAMIVTNHDTATITNVNASTPTFTTIPSVSPILNSSSPSTNSTLLPSESVIFKWNYNGIATEFSGNVSSSASANSGLSTGVKMTTITVRNDTSGTNGTSGGTTGTISDDQLVDTDRLFKPEIYVMKPNPMGDASSKGLWGITIANPSASTISVNKVVVSLFSPANLQTMFDASGGSDKCAPQSVYPVTSPLYQTGNWVCSIQNQLVWTNVASPESIPAYSSKTIMATVNPGTLGAGSVSILDSIVLHIAAYTNIGEFGKAGYGTGMYDLTSDTAIANVFLTNNTGSNNLADIVTSVTSLNNTSVTFKASLANFESSKNIRTGTNLVINIPIGWDKPVIVSNSGFSAPVVQTVGAHWQIVATTSANIANTAKTVVFTSVSPDVKSPKLQLMSLLAYGLADAGSSSTFPVAPLTEIILSICPTTTSPNCT